MNAAARLVHQNILSRPFIFIYGLTRLRLAIIFLTFTLLLSALGIIYIAQSYHMLYADYNNEILEHNRLSQQYRQLVLEESLSTIQSGIEQEAENKLNMIYPTHEQTIIIHE